MPTETFLNLPDDKRRQLIDIAMNEFATKPYEQASISNIVKQAGIAKGSIYQYFENKQDLYLHLIDVVTQEKLKFIQKNMPPLATTDFFDTYKQQMLVGARFNLSYPLGMNLLANMVKSPLSNETHAKMQQVADDYLVNLVRQQQAKGAVRDDISPEIIAYFYKAIANGLADYLAAQTGIQSTEWIEERNAKKLLEIDLEPIIDQLVQLMRSATAAKAAKK